ncbi:hypothetical protein PoB_004697800 [Plakobranchus ocellatus]|uniref:Uncharacterized protein n=1 Tax=Plakobranchus ocellatus TaxID=259542 RepID=A0AAV4BNW9_9GAST|nr:hypothetical protein PoB_004697800 [Plakobranchus ocellatus]
MTRQKNKNNNNKNFVMNFTEPGRLIMQLSETNAITDTIDTYPGMSSWTVRSGPGVWIPPGFIQHLYFRRGQFEKAIMLKEGLHTEAALIASIALSK